MHAWLLNSAAMTAIGPIEVADLAGGLVIDDRGDVRRAFGRISEPGAVDGAVRAWSTERLGQGVTTLVDAGASNTLREVEALASWREQRMLVQRVAAFVVEEAAADAQRASTEIPVLGTKLMFAGEQRTEADARRRLHAAWSRGPLAAVHCADLESLAHVIEAAEATSVRRRRALRIEHASICPPDWISRVADVRAHVVTQPSFVHAHGDRYLRTVERHLHSRLYRQRSWVEAGVPMDWGSDELSGPDDPLLAWRAAFERRTAEGEVLGPDERLTRADAMAALARRAADACLMPDVGRLRVGARGCAAVLSGDPLAGGPLDGVGRRADDSRRAPERAGCSSC